ncbi:MAG TPA: hypothetical protein VEV84_10545 [Pyrinomonadaceae bacterium]|jgi:hypothetical protein|nr:hypothetical protein [Pyrinomonadaceae bacterium]
MIDEEGIRAIITQYEKFSWRLRRALLTSELRDRLGSSLTGLFGNAEIIDSDLDAAWFSRPSKGKSIAWELRRLDEFPFALVEVVDIDSLELTEVFERLEDDMRNRVRPRSQGN